MPKRSRKDTDEPKSSDAKGDAVHVSDQASQLASSKPKKAKIVPTTVKCVAVFDIRSNHRYKCDNGARFYKSRDHGLTCCSAVVENSSYEFELEPHNAYDSNAVMITGEQTGELVGHVPRECNIEVGDVLRRAKTHKNVNVYGESMCGRLLQIKCLVEGPEDVLEEYFDEYDSDY